MVFKPEQKKQIDKQIEAYEKLEKISLIKIPFKNEMLEFEIDPFVANPEIMNSGIQVMKYLENNPDIVKDKVVTDMGAGSGIIGISAGLLGAKSVFMPEIDVKAVNNATKNIKRYNLEKICNSFTSDLFSNYGDRPKSNIQIFNHPFFIGKPIENKKWTRMMLGETELLSRYFEEAPKYSTIDAKYILPWLMLAANEGDELDNDPGKRALMYGYKLVKTTEQQPVQQGIQQNIFRIYELER